jgi:hypothetical protein
LQQRIQVTADADTWFSLTVTDLLDPTSVKDAILTRLNISPHNGPYEFIHENGPYPGMFNNTTFFHRTGLLYFS